MSGNIILDARRVLALEAFEKIGEYAGCEKAWLDELWTKLIDSEPLMTEFMYYVDHHTFSGESLCRGYGLTDMYFYVLRKYNLSSDLGKNSSDCNKEALALLAINEMYEMIKKPDLYESKLSFGMGMDIM